MVEAIQWLGNNFDEIVDFLTLTDLFKSQYYAYNPKWQLKVVEENKLEIFIHDRYYIVKIGDWIVKEEDSIFHLEEQNTFSCMYEYI